MASHSKATPEATGQFSLVFAFVLYIIAERKDYFREEKQGKNARTS